MFLTLAFVCSAGPEFTVENKCPPSFTVTNRCPAPKAKPAAPAKNGRNCGASFCSAQGGPGCAATGRSCPNGVGGVCVCGAKPASINVLGPAEKQAFYLLPGTAYQSCPGGNCPTGR